jgi:ArsR family transcriptional regulator
MAKLKSTLPPPDFEGIAYRHAALAEPNRVKLLHLLTTRGELTVTDLVAGMTIAQPTVSFHLRRLTQAGLVKRRKEAAFVFYSATMLGEDLLRFG